MMGFIAGVLSVAAAVAALDFVFPLTFVSGYSMFPTYNDGDILFGSRLHRKFVDVGDVVVLRHPNEKGKLIIKRVHKVKYGIDRPGNILITHVYVLGDNLNNSNDSRVFGYIPIKDVVTKIIYPMRRKEDIPYDYGF